MKNRNELVEKLSREIIQEGINLERAWDFKEVNSERSIVEEDYAKARSGRYNGVDGFYFNRAVGFEFDSEEQESIKEIMNEYGFTVIAFSPWEMEYDGDRAHKANVSFVKK